MCLLANTITINEVLIYIYIYIDIYIYLYIYTHTDIDLLERHSNQQVQAENVTLTFFFKVFHRLNVCDEILQNLPYRCGFKFPESAKKIIMQVENKRKAGGK